MVDHPEGSSSYGRSHGRGMSDRGGRSRGGRGRAGRDHGARGGESSRGGPRGNRDRFHSQRQGGHRGGYGGHSSRAGAGATGNNFRRSGPNAGGERPKRDNILDLTKYIGKAITVKFNGGREVKGTLKGFDALMNLVLDETTELLRAPLDEDGKASTRSLGLVVVRGTMLVVVTPVEGSERIENPFASDNGILGEE